MYFDQNDIDKILANNLTLDFVKIILAQQVSDNPVIYHGPGSIYQDHQGRLVLKMYHVFENTDAMIKDMKTIFSGGEHAPGKLITKEHFYSLKAIAMDGTEWFSENIWIDGKISMPAVGKVVNARLRFIESTSTRHIEEDYSRSAAYSIIPGKHTFPCNKVQKTDNSLFRNTCEIDIGDSHCTIVNKDSYITLTYSSGATTKFEATVEVLLEGLSIGIGDRLRPIYQEISNDDYRKLIISSGYPTDSNKNIHPPIPARITDDIINLHDFLDSYISTFSNSWGMFYSYWHRIISSLSSDYQNTSLVLSIAIEGILKEYFAEWGNPDSEFVAQTQAAIPVIDRCREIGDRAKARLVSTLGNAKSFTAKNSLYALQQRGLITKVMIDNWEKLRNQSAHGYVIENNEEELQQLIDKVNTCYALYYKLMMVFIGYNCHFIDYSMPGWPKMPMCGADTLLK